MAFTWTYEQTFSDVEGTLASILKNIIASRMTRLLSIAIWENAVVHVDSNSFDTAMDVLCGDIVRRGLQRLTITFDSAREVQRYNGIVTEL